MLGEEVDVGEEFLEGFVVPDGARLIGTVFPDWPLNARNVSSVLERTAYFAIDVEPRRFIGAIFDQSPARGFEAPLIECDKATVCIGRARSPDLVHPWEMMTTTTGPIDNGPESIPSSGVSSGRELRVHAVNAPLLFGYECGEPCRTPRSMAAVIVVDWNVQVPPANFETPIGVRSTSSPGENWPRAGSQIVAGSRWRNSLTVPSGLVPLAPTFSLDTGPTGDIHAVFEVTGDPETVFAAAEVVLAAATGNAVEPQGPARFDGDRGVWLSTNYSEAGGYGLSASLVYDDQRHVGFLRIHGNND